eukprot:s1617_g1.t1
MTGVSAEKRFTHSNTQIRGQRLLYGEREMEDEEEISSDLEAQLVLLGFWPSEAKEDEEFISACAENDLTILERLLKKPQCPDTRDIDGWPALHTAAAAGHEERSPWLNPHEDCVSMLLEARADQDKVALEDCSAPLHWAAGHGHLGVARLLLEARAQQDHSAAESGWTPLHSAVLGGHDMVTLLLDARAACDQAETERGRTPLHLAANQRRGSGPKESHVEVVRKLLAARADAEKEDTKKGWKPISFAAAAGNAQVMQALLEVQANVNDSEPPQLSRADEFDSWDAAPLFLAVDNGHCEGVRLLLGARAKCTAESLRAAAENGDVELVEMLLEGGAEANPDDCPNNWTPLHAAVESHRSEVVPLLLQAAADPNIPRLEDGWTPLHFAARSGDLKIARCLMAAGGNKDKAGFFEGRWNQTPWHLAAKYRHEAVVLFLMALAQTVTPNCAMPFFIDDRQYYSKESAARLYGALPYHLANAVSEAVVCAINGVLASGIATYLAGLPLSGQWFSTMAFLVSHHMCSSALDVAFVLSAGYIIVCMLFANIVVKVATVTPYLAWIRWATFMYFSMAGLIEVEFEDTMEQGYPAGERAIEGFLIHYDYGDETYTLHKESCFLIVWCFYTLFSSIGFLALKFGSKSQVRGSKDISAWELAIDSSMGIAPEVLCPITVWTPPQRKRFGRFMSDTGLQEHVASAFSPWARRRCQSESAQPEVMPIRARSD